VKIKNVIGDDPHLVLGILLRRVTSGGFFFSTEVGFCAPILWLEKNRGLTFQGICCGFKVKKQDMGSEKSL